MRSDKRTWLAAAGTAALVGLCGCTTAAGGPEPAVEAGGAGKPPFFVQWKADLPGLTRRPSLAPDSELPEYPAAAVRAEISGVTTLETCVTADGHLTDYRLAGTSGSAILDDATLTWAKIAKFHPAEINGEAFAVCGYRFDQEWRVAN